MGRMDVSKALTLAYEQMVTMLFKPFVFRKWIALGFIFLMAFGGVGGSGSGGNVPTPNEGNRQEHKQEYKPDYTYRSMHMTAATLQQSFASAGKGPYSQPRNSLASVSNDVSSMPLGARSAESVIQDFLRSLGKPLDQASVQDFVTKCWVAVVIGLGVIIILCFVFAWLSSVFQFVYVDDISKNSGAIAEPFARLKGLGTRFFWWRIAYGFTLFFVILLLLGYGFYAGGANEQAFLHGPFIVAFLITMGLLLLSAFIGIFGNDFLVPTMYVRNIGVIAGWKTVFPILGRNAGQVVLYILMLIALAIGRGIASLLVGLVLLLVFAVLGGILVLFGYLIYSLAGQASVAPLVTVGIVLGLGLVLALSLAMSAAIQPVVIFRKALSLAALGQADPTLVTLPNMIPPSEEASGASPVV